MNTPTHLHKTRGKFCRRIVRAWTMSPATPFALLFAAFTLWCTPAQAQFAQPLYAYTFTAGKAATYDLPTLSGATAYSTDIGGSANFSVDVTSTPPALLSEVELGQEWYVETHTFVYTATAQNANGDAVDYAAQIELMVQPQLQIISSEYPYYFQQQLPRYHKTIHKIVAYGGLQPHTWAVTPALPSELTLTLDASGATIDGFLPDNSASVHTFSVTDALGATDSAEIDIRSATHRAVNFHQPDSAYFVTFTAGTATSHELVDITGNTVHLDEKTPMRIGAYTVNLGNGFYRGASSDSLASHEHRVYSTTSIAAGQVTQFVLYNAGLDFENDFIDERSAVNFILIVVAKPAFNIPDQYLTVDTPYAATFTAAGGYGGLTYAIAADAPPLPPGMTLTATAGGVVLSGAPTAPGGQQTYRITATDENGGVGEGVVYIRDFSFIGFEQTSYRYTFAVGSLSQFDLPTRLGVSDWHVSGDLDEGIRFDTAQMPPIIYNDLFVAPGLHTFKYTALGAAFETVEIEAWVWDASFHSYEFTAGHASTLTLPTLPGASGYVVDLPPDQTTSAYTFARTLTYDLTANPPTISKAADTIAGATTYTAGIFTFWLRPSGDGAAVPAARIEIMVNEPLGFASRESAYDWHKSGGTAAHKEYTFTATGGTAPFFFAITPSPKSNKLTFVSVPGANIARLFGADPAQRNYAIEAVDGLGATATHQITVRTRSLNSYETYDNQSRSLTFTAGAAVTFKMQDLYPNDWQKWVDHNRDFDTTDLPTGLNAGLAACTYDVTRDDVFCYLRNINSTTAVEEGASAIIYLNNLSQPGPCNELSTSCGVHTQSNVDAALYLTTAPQPHIDIDRINLTAATAVDQTYTALGAFPFTFAAAADNPITPPGLTIESTEAALVFRGAAYAPLPDRQYVYAITDNNGISQNATFTLQIGPYFELPLYAITFSGGVAGLHNLPQASGAIASYVHTLNYTGLTFDAADGAVNGLINGLMLRSQTNTATGDVTFNLTAHVNDAVFAQTKIAVHIAAPPAFAANVQTTFEVATDIAVDFALPQLEQGVMPVGYGITGYLPDGLRLEAVNNFAARIIGTPTRAHGADAMLHAIDAAGATTQIPIHIIVRDRPGFAPFVVDATYTVNFATYSADGVTVADTITLPEAQGGVGQLTYSLDAANQLPAGITATELADNRIIISGTPTETGEFVYTRYVTDSAIPSPRQATFTLQFTVIPPPSFGALTADNLNVSRGRQVYELLPRAASPLPLVYTFAPTPPDGITFDAEAVALIGAPTTPDGGTLFTLSVIDSHGASASLPAFAIRVVDTPMFDALSGTTHFTYTRNTTFAQPYTFAPSTVGGAPPFQHRFFDVDIRALDLGDYADIDALRDAVRATLSVDGNNNGIIDPPLHTVGEFELRYSRVDANDAIGKSGFVTFSIIPRVQYESDPLGPFAFVRGAGGEYIFNVVGGIGDVTHRITPALPSGIEFSGERVLTLAQTASAAVMPETDYTLHITDANGETGMSEMSIRVVAAAPTFAQNLYALTFVQSVKKVLTLPRATGESVDTLTYRLTDTDIAEYAQLGLTFSSVNGAYPITVTNREDALPMDFAKTFSAYFNADNDATLNVDQTTLTFQFFAAPTFAAQPNIVFASGQINTYTLAQADAGVGRFTYSLMRNTDPPSALPGGLAFDAATRQLRNTGGITAAADGEYLLRAIDAEGAQTQLTFEVAVREHIFSFAPPGPFVFVSGAGGTYDLTIGNASGALDYGFSRAFSTGVFFDTDATPAIWQFGVAPPLPLTTYRTDITDANGIKDSFEFAIQVVATAPTFAQTQFAFTFVRDVKKTLTLPRAMGAAASALSYELLSVDIAAYAAQGVTFSSALGQYPITATNDVAAAFGAVDATFAARFSVNADATLGADYAGLSFVFSPAPTFAVQPSGLTYIAARVAAYTLAAAGGGSGAFNYSLAREGNAAFGGLTFDVDTRELRADATVAAADGGEYFLSAVDAEGNSVHATFSVTVNTPVMIGALNTYVFTRGTRGSYTLPIDGGLGALTYNIAPPLPNALTISGERQIVLRQPISQYATVMGVTVYTMTVTANGDSATAELPIEVAEDLNWPSGSTANDPDRQFTFTQTVDSVRTLPTHPTAPKYAARYRLEWDANSQPVPQSSFDIWGFKPPVQDRLAPIIVTSRADASPIKRFVYNVVYYAADSTYGGRDNDGLYLLIVPPPAFTALPSNITFTQFGVKNAYRFAIDPATGTPPIAYTFIPADLDAIDRGGYASEAALIAEATSALKGDGLIGATFSQTGEFAMRIIATDTHGASVTSDFVTFTIVPPPQFSEPLGTYLLTPGTAGNFTMPSAEGGFGAYSASVDPPLPNGVTVGGAEPPFLVQDKNQSPALTDFSLYTMTITDANGGPGSGEFAIRVFEPPVFDPPTVGFTFLQGVKNEFTLPQAQSAQQALLTYALSINRAALAQQGLTFSADAAQYPITITNRFDAFPNGARFDFDLNAHFHLSSSPAAQADVTVLFVVAPTFSAQPDITFVTGQTATHTLNRAANGLELSYQLARQDAGAFPPALTFDSSTREVHADAAVTTDAAGVYLLNALDVTGQTAQVTFSIFISQIPVLGAFDSAFYPYTFTAGKAATYDLPTVQNALTYSTNIAAGVDYGVQLPAQGSSAPPKLYSATSLGGALSEAHTFEYTAGGHGQTASAQIVLAVAPQLAVHISQCGLAFHPSVVHTHDIPASGGVPPHSWTLSPALPSSLTFDATDAVASISGVLASGETSQYIVQAEDANNAIASATFSIQSSTDNLVSLASAYYLTFTASTVTTYNVASTAGANLFAPGFTKQLGVGVYGASETIAGDEYATLVYSTADATAGQTVVVPLFSDPVDSNSDCAPSSTQFVLIVVSKPSFAAIADQTAAVDAAYSLSLRAEHGALPLTYELTATSPPLPNGLTLSADGELSGVPTAESGYAAHYIRVTDKNGASGETTFNLRVQASAPIFASAQPALTYTNGSASTYTLGAATFGVGALQYSVTRLGGGFPAALAFDSAMLELRNSSGISTNDAGNYVLSVADENGAQAHTTFAIVVAERMVVGALLTYAFIPGTAGSYTLPVSGGLGQFTYSVDPPLPSGLTLGGEHPTVLWQPQREEVAEMGLTVYTMTVTANGVSLSAEFAIVVIEDTYWFRSSHPKNIFTFTQTVTAEYTLPQHTDALPYAAYYHLGSDDGTGRLVSQAELDAWGLSISAQDVLWPITVTNRPDAPVNSVRVLYAIYYTPDADGFGGGRDTTTVSFIIVPPPTFAPPTTNITFTRLGVNNAHQFAPIDPTTGTPPIAYTFIPADLDAIDNGGYANQAALIAEATDALKDGGLIGATFSHTGEFAMRLTATDTHGAIGTSDYVTFTIIDPPRFTASLGTYVFTPGTEGTYTLPSTEGGFGAHSIRIDPPLPNGLTLSSITPPVLQQPDGEEVAVMDLTVYTMTVTDANGASADTEFSIQVGAKLIEDNFWTPREPRKENYTFTQTVAADITLPQHTDALPYAAIYYYGVADLLAQLDAMGLSITEQFNPYPMVVSSRVGATLGVISFPYGVFYVLGGDIIQTTLSFHVVAAPTFAPQPSDITFSQSGAGNAFTFSPIDPATGTPPIQYSVDAAGDDIVPIDAGGYRAGAALRGAVDTAFDAESGIVSAVFSQTGKFALRYNATDAYGASVTSEYVTFTIVEAPQFSAPLGTYVFTPGSGGSYTIPLSGGTMLTYSVDPALPSGLSISGVDPAILAQTATASEMALTVYTMQVTDANNAEVEREFAIQVAPALTWTGAGISDEFTFTQTVNTNVTLPQNPDAVAFAARYFLGNNTDGARISEAALTALGLSASQHPAPYPITVGNLDGATLGARVLQYNIEYTDTAASNGGRAAIALTFHIVTAPTFAAIADGDVTFSQDGVNNAYTFAPIDGGGALPIAYTFVLTDVAAIERGGYTDGDSLIAAVITSVDARGGNDGVFGATFANTGKFTLRQTAIDNNGAIATSDSVTFTIVARPRFESALTDSLVFVSGGGGAYSFANPASGGVGALTYSSTTLPSGLGASGVHTATITQSGTASIGASMTYAITATDENGAPGAGNIAIQVVALPTFASSVYAFTFQQGVSSAFTLPQADGDALHALTYQVVGDATFIDDYAQAGLTFSKQTASAPIVVNNRKDALFTGEGEINFVAYYSANADDTLGKARTILSFVYQQADAPVFATPQPDVTYTLGTANKVTLVEASNSIGGLTYTLSRISGTVPAALTLEPSTREMRSTTSIAETDSGEYIATATDENGSSAAVTFNLVVTDIILSQSLGPFYFVSGAGGGHNFTARGGGALTYAFAPALPNGLAVVEGDPPALRQTATAAAIGLSTYALTVTDENGATAGAEVTLQVFASAPTFDAAQTIYTFIRGEPQSITLPRVTGDGAAFVTYTLQGGAQAISDYAVAGLTFSKHTAQYPIVITNRLDAMLSGGVSSATFTSYFSTDATSSGKATTLLSFVTIAPNAPVFNAAQTDLALSASRARTITLSRATAAVGVITHTFTRIIGAVPAALDFDGDAHQLRIGTAIAVGDSGDYILHAANALDQTAALTFAITVHPLPTFAVAQLELTFTIGARTSHTLPLASGGGGALAYSMSALPGQLQFDSTVNELLYLGGASPGAQSLTLTVTDTLTATDELNIEVQFVDVPSFANDASALLTNGVSFRVGASIVANTTLPQATAGTPPLTYRLTDGANSSYESTDAAATLSANGITFDATTRIISGTPLAAAVQSFAYHARDRHAQTASHNTTMHSIDSLTLSQENLAVEIAATFALSLNAVNHAIGAITYSLTNLDGSAPSLPSGVAYNAGANQLSGIAPNAAFTGEFIVSAVDGFDNTAAQATFIFSAASLVFMPASASITYTRGANRFTANGVTSNALTLPAASGGRGALTYAVATPPPNDIVANVRADQRVFISGIARDLGDFTYVRTVRDIDNRSATFSLAINVVDAPRFDTAQGENRYTISHLHTFTLHPASGGFGALSYWITPPLPNEVQLIQTPPSIIGHPPAVLGATEYTLTAVDANGASVSTELLFDNYDLLFWRAAAQQTFAVGVTFSVDDDDVLLPRPGGGLVPYRYELHGLRGQLSFENQTVNQTLYGPLTITFPSQVTPAPLVTYVAIDANRAAITAVFNLHITPMINPQPMRELTFGVGATTHQLTPLANLRVAAGGEVRYEFSPTPRDVGLYYDAATHRLMSDDSFTNQPPAILTYSLTAAYVSQAATVAAVTQTIVLQVDAADAPVTPSVSETEIERLREINEVILPEVAAATVAATLGAITERIADFGTTPTTTPSPLVSLGGYAPQMALAQAAKAHADGVLDAKDFLNGSRFVVPVSAARERGGAAVWGGVHYRNIDGGGGDEVVEWRGNVDGMHLGFDYKQNNLLLGIAVAKHNGVFDYTSIDGADGEYDITVDSQYQYIDWQRGDLNLWLSAGGGDGELTITQAGEEFIGDIDMAAAGLGVSDDLSAHLQVRGEWRGAEMKVIGNAAQTLRDQTIRANSVRLLAKWRSRDLSEEHHSFVELGMRNDGGDGDTGAAIESALGWRHLSHRTDLELRAHGVFGRNEYKEWGAYGQLRISGGDDEQGLALRVRPSYGGPTRDFGAIWDVESLAAFDGAQDDSNSDDGVYQWRNESRLSYGIQSGGGLFAPFGEVITADANDIYRLGVDWSPHRHFDLNLTGEHRRNENQLGERRILLRGEVAF